MYDTENGPVAVGESGLLKRPKKKNPLPCIKGNELMLHLHVRLSYLSTGSGPGPPLPPPFVLLFFFFVQSRRQANGGRNQFGFYCK